MGKKHFAGYHGGRAPKCNTELHHIEPNYGCHIIPADVVAARAARHHVAQG
jgi:hypothetical protein